MKTQHSEHTLRIVIAAMFAAMVAVMTAFVKVSTPTGGVVHLGDSIIYLVSSFLPLPYAIAASAIGGGIADLLVYPETILYTIVIKALNAVFFSSKGDKILTKRNALMTIPSGLVTVVGYSLSKVIRQLLLGNTMQVALIDGIRKIPENSIQAVASAVIFILVAVAFDKAGIKKRMLGL